MSSSTKSELFVFCSMMPAASAGETVVICWSTTVVDEQPVNPVSTARETARRLEMRFMG